MTTVCLKPESASKLNVALVDGSVVSSVDQFFLYLQFLSEFLDHPVVIEKHVHILPGLTSDVILGIDWL